MINLRQLYIFSVVAESNSLAAASELLNMTAAAVSLSLKGLEQQLNTRLLQRAPGRKSTDKTILLTAEGIWLKQRAQDILALEKSTQMYFKQRQESEPTALNIGASQTVGNYWLPGYIRDIKQRYPCCQVNVFIGNTDEALDRVQTFRDDIALVEGPNHHSALKSRCFKKDSLMLIAPPDNDFESLQTAPWLIRERGSATRKYTEQLWAELAIEPKDVTQLNTNESIIHSVASGVGVAYVPRITTPLLLDAALIKEIPINNNCYRSLFIVKHKERDSELAWIDGLV